MWCDRDQIRNAKLKGQEMAIAKEVEAATRKLIRQNPELLGADYVELLNTIGVAKSRFDKPWAFITVNPRSGTDVTTLATKMQKLLQKKWIQGWYSYHFETTEKDHNHVHMIVYRGAKVKSEIIRETYNTFKDVCADKASIDVKLIASEEAKVYDYVHKQDEHKHESAKFFEKFFVNSSKDGISEEDLSSQEGDS